jgi:hypothetical protein
MIGTWGGGGDKCIQVVSFLVPIIVNQFENGSIYGWIILKCILHVHESGLKVETEFKWMKIGMCTGVLMNTVMHVKIAVFWDITSCSLVIGTNI